MQYAEHRRIMAGIRHQVTLTTTYPAIVLALLATLLLAAAHLLGNEVVSMLQDFGVAIPLPTRLLVELVGLTNYVTMGVAAAVATILIVGPRTWRGGLKRVPMFGPVWRWTAQAEFCQLMSLIVERDVPLSTALRLTAGGLHDRDLSNAALRLAFAADRGTPLGVALAAESEFSPTLAPWLGWAQQSNTTAYGFATAAQIFLARVRSQVSLLKIVLPPMMLVLVGWGVAFLAAALLLPMVTLVRSLS
jgi:type II secretory pathway component PulF